MSALAKQSRAATGLAPIDFAYVVGVPLITVHAWEKGAKSPTARGDRGSSPCAEKGARHGSDSEVSKMIHNTLKGDYLTAPRSPPYRRSLLEMTPEVALLCRESLDITQTEMGRLLGVKRPAIIAWENGRIPIPLRYWRTYSRMHNFILRFPCNQEVQGLVLSRDYLGALGAILYHTRNPDNWSGL